MYKRSMAAAAVIGASVLAITACSSSSSSSSSSGGGSSATSSSTGAALTGACAPYSSYAGPKGTVTIFGSIISPESNSLAKSWAQFEQCTGITINYTGSNTFESDLPVKVNGGNPPEPGAHPAARPAHADGAGRRRQDSAGPDGRQRGELEPALEELRLGRRHVLRRPHEREHEVARVVLAEVLLGERLHGADHVGGPDVPVREDRQGAARPSRGAAGSARARRAAGRPRTGSRRSSSASTAPRSTRTGSRTRSSSTARRSWRR